MYEVQDNKFIPFKTIWIIIHSVRSKLGLLGYVNFWEIKQK